MIPYNKMTGKNMESTHLKSVDLDFYAVVNNLITQKMKNIFL